MDESTVQAGASNTAAATRVDGGASAEQAPDSSYVGSSVSGDVALEELRTEIRTLQAELRELQDEAYKDKIIAQHLDRIAALEKSVSILRDARLATMMHYDLVAGIESEYRLAAQADPAGQVGRWVLDLEVVRGDIESQLVSLGLQMYRLPEDELHAGTRIAFETQRAARVEPTTNRNEDMVVVCSIRAGFRDFEGRSVRKEDVVVKRYHANS